MEKGIITMKNNSICNKFVKRLPVFIFLGFITMIILSEAVAFPEDEIINNLEGIFYLDGSPVEIEIADGNIQKITRKQYLKNPQNKDVFIAPGFIDHQVNGCLGIEFSNLELTAEKVRNATHALWKAGVTTYIPTLTTNSKEALLHGFSVLVKSIEEYPQLQMSIAGFHLEGPYISPVDGYRGAHNKQWVRSPNWQEFVELYKAANENILQVTVAPEVEGAIEFIQKCTHLGIKVSIGHHNAPADIVQKAADAGAVLSTHLGNGCANMINRHLNPLWPQLAEDRLMISIICDGFHLQPEEVRTFFKVKGIDRTLITSDAGSLAGLPAGTYESNGKELQVTKEGMIKYPAQNVLAGSASFIDKGVGNIMKFTDCRLADAVHMASRNQADLFGLNDRGLLKPGKRADIILFRLENYKINILQTYLAGNLVYDANESK
jgi:N-acetylglucosamine-6-phosphate deacetylase